MWNVIGHPAPHDWITFEPVEILDEFDYPRIFTCNDVAGHLYLAYSCGRYRDGLRFLVVPCSDSTVIGLVQGTLNLRDSISRDRAWVFDLDKHWMPVRAWKVDVDKLPFNALPRPGTMLYADLPQVVVSNRTRTCSAAVEITSSWNPRGIRPQMVVNG